MKVTSTSPIVKDGKKLTRKFLGKINSFIDRGEKLFEKAHLKAYLAGKTYFKYGWTVSKQGVRYKPTFEVKQEYFYV